MKATEFKTIAKDAASNQLAQAFAAAKTESEPAFNPQRRAYQGETLLSANRSVSCDTWRSGLNNNVLVLGSSGGGKTRNHVKPNLLQCQGSYIVLDCKGSLYHEMGRHHRIQPARPHSLVRGPTDAAGHHLHRIGHLPC